MQAIRDQMQNSRDYAKSARRSLAEFAYFAVLLRRPPRFAIVMMLVWAISGIITTLAASTIVAAPPPVKQTAVSGGSGGGGGHPGHAGGGGGCPGPNDDSKTSDEAQARLMKDLFNGYDKRVRPVRNYSKSVDTILTMTLYQLVAVNEPEEYVSINIWMAHSWEDDFLAWDPALYDNIDYLVVPWDQVWLSDIVLYNGLDMDHWSSEKRINVELSMLPGNSSAHVRFAFPAVYRFNCKMDIYTFPFDRQNCTMVFGSWVYDTRYVDVRPHADSVKMENFIANQEWEVLSFESYRHVLNYSCCPYPYTNVQYHFVIQRKPLFFVCNYVLPTIIVSFVAICGFFTPGHTTGERSEKMNLGISTCLAISILLLMVSDRMPTAGNYIPMMALFYLAIIILVAIAICMTTVIIHIQRRARHGVHINEFVRHLCFSVLAPLLFIEIPDSILVHPPEKKSPIAPLARCEEGHILDSAPASARGVENHHGNGNNGGRSAVLMNNSAMANTFHFTEPMNNKTFKNAAGKTFSLDLSPRAATHPSVRYRGGSLAFEKGGPINEWECLADVVERLLLVAFLTVLVSLCAGTFYTAFRSMA